MEERCTNLKLMMSPKHRSKPAQTFDDINNTFAMQAKVDLVQGQLLMMKNRVQELEAEKVVLLKENEEVLNELLKLRKEVSQEYSRIARMAYQINIVCESKSQGCCCCGPEEADQ